MKIACRFRALRDSAARRNEAAAAQLQHTSLLSSGHGAASFLFVASSVLAAIQPIEASISASPFGFTASMLRLIEVAEFPETSAF
jgi:hypothetical protein